MQKIFFALVLILTLTGSTLFLEPLATVSANGSIPSEITQYINDWPLPNKDYANTRFTADATINSSNVGNLKLTWSFKIPGIGAYGGGASNPIIMGNNIYFQDMKANVFSLNAQDGHVNWEKIYNISAVVGPNGPAVGWGKVFVAKDLYTIVALNASTGEEIWATRISNINTTGIDIQPSVYDNMVYVSTVPGTADVFYAAGGIGVIYALDQTTGDIMWNFSTVDTPDLWGHPEINSGGGCWYTPAIDVNSGVTYWGISNPAPFPGVEGWPSGSSRPAPNLYTDSMMALYHNNGTMKWFNQVLPHDLFDHDLQIAPILANANINGSQQDIVIGSGKGGIVYAFNRDTGAILWQTDVGEHQNDTLTVLPPGNTRVLPGVLGGVETPMAYSVSDKILYVPVVDLFTDFTPTSINGSTLDLFKGTGELVAINVSTGNILWSKLFNSINVGGATVVNDIVFTATFDGTIYGFKTRTGEQLFNYKAPAGINGWPAVAGNMIVWPAGFGANASVIALSIAPTTLNFTLYGAFDKGWGFTPTSISSPGPTITVEQGDIVNMALISTDGIMHNFFVSYTNTSSPSTGDPKSNDFTTTTSFQFTATTTVGTYKYYCFYHSAMMWGYFQVVPTQTTPELQNATLTIQSSAASVVAGSAVTISGSLSPAGTGDVTIYESINGSAWNVLTLAPLVGGAYTYTFTPSALGTYQFYALRPGDSQYNPASSSTISVLVTAVQLITPTLTLQSSAANVNPGQTITLSGTITPSATGTVTLSQSINGSAYQQIASVPLSGGAYSYQVVIPGNGTYTFQASFAGNDQLNPAQSSTVTVSSELVIPPDYTLYIVAGVIIVAVAIIAIYLLAIRPKNKPTK